LYSTRAEAFNGAEDYTGYIDEVVLKIYDILHKNLPLVDFHHLVVILKYWQQEHHLRKSY
jgi:hypothetical protein